MDFSDGGTGFGMGLTKGRWAVLVAAPGAVLVGLALWAGVPDSGRPDPRPARGDCRVSDKLVPRCGLWWGVAPGVFTRKSTEEALADFERATGRRVHLLHMYHRDGQIFPTDRQIAMARDPRGRRMLFLNWKPELGRTWAEVAAGDPEVDRHIDAVAARIRDVFPERFFLAVHHEPEDEVRPDPGSGFTAHDYRAMVRYVITRLRNAGVANAVTVMAYMGVPNHGSQPWFNDLYPGDDVIDWVAADLYADRWVSDFATLVNKTRPDYPDWPGFYRWATSRFPGKPLMLAEWGTVNRRRDPGFSARFFASVPRQLRDYPRIKGLLYFESPDTPVGDTRWNVTMESAREFRRIARMRDFDRPRLP